MRFNATAILRDEATDMTLDAEGNEIAADPPEDVEVFCNVRSVGIETWATVAELGIKPEAQIQVRSCDYDNQTIVILDGRMYDVSYTSTRGDFTIITLATHIPNG